MDDIILKFWFLNSEQVSHGSPQSLQENTEILHKLGHGHFLPHSFPIHYSLITPLFSDVYSKPFKVLTNKPGIIKTWTQKAASLCFAYSYL